MIRVGILGTGFGEYHAKLYQKVEGVEVVSIFGRNRDKLNRIKQEYNIQTTTDLMEIIHNPIIDLIDICLPTELHMLWAIEGLKSGKHIFCETPISYSVSEAEAIKQASLQYKKNVYVDMFLKFSTPHATAIRMAKEEKMGKLVFLRAYNKTSPRWGDLSIVKNVETFHIHNIDFVQEIMGTPDAITASGIDLDGKSIVTSAFHYMDKYAVLESNTSMPDNCPYGIGFELIFGNGVIKYDAAYGEHMKEEFEVLRKDMQREVIKLDMKDDYEEAIRHVVSCIQNNQKSELIDIECAVDSINAKDRILKKFSL